MPQKKIAVVTEGNKGVGFAICRRLAEEGVLVALTARSAKRGRFPEATKRRPCRPFSSSRRKLHRITFNNRLRRFPSPPIRSKKPRWKNAAYSL